MQTITALEEVREEQLKAELRVICKKMISMGISVGEAYRIFDEEWKRNKLSMHKMKGKTKTLHFSMDLSVNERCVENVKRMESHMELLLDTVAYREIQGIHNVHIEEKEE